MEAHRRLLSQTCHTDLGHFIVPWVAQVESLRGCQLAHCLVHWVAQVSQFGVWWLSGLQLLSGNKGMDSSLSAYRSKTPPCA